MSQASLKIEPIFSNNQDPYEKIKWKTFDAVIKNNKGDIVFEQKDVEFPEFWSQLAVNIVVSKYFYGKLGTDQREKSLKQLIDRVVNFITDNGVKRGYFDAENGAAFKNELKYIMVNQIATFNSPVHFNAGIFDTYGINDKDTFPNYYWDMEKGEVRQCNNLYQFPQCSACFILEIQDNLKSLFDAATIEGKIFRSGSGVGTNDSFVRSSKEGISGGGISSGCISFMKIRDQVASVVKSGGRCFAEGTLIATPNGLTPIEELSAGDIVLTHDGEKPITDFFNNGEKQCYLIETTQGYSVETTLDHKFVYWDSNIGDYGTKPLSDFKPGDNLFLLTSPCRYGKKIYLQKILLNEHNSDIKLPKYINDKFAYVLGLLYGDGSVNHDSGTISCAFSTDSFGNKSRKKYIKYIKELFGNINILEYDTKKNCIVVSISRKRIYEFLKLNNILKGKSDNLVFPKAILQAKWNIRAAFYAGVFDADGCYRTSSGGGFNISMNDLDFIKNLQKLLISFGIPSKIGISSHSGGNWKTTYGLYASGSSFTIQLFNIIKNYSEKAVTNFVHFNGSNCGWGYKSVFKNDLKKFLQRGEKNYVNQKVGGYFKQTLSYGAVIDIAKKLPESPVGIMSKKLSKCVNITIKSIAPSRKVQTYDFEVADTHTISACGIYTSNSRRAAIARTLNYDHPDILEFIDIKSKEEKKVQTLVNAGYDGSFNGEAYSSIFFQNANFSINVTDEFMQKVTNNETYWTKFVTTGENCQELNACDVIKKIAEGTWQCGDPGMQFIDTVNKWHTSSQSGRISGNNPCFEYLYLNNTACSLSSLNIMKFRKEDGAIDIEKYLYAIRLLILAQEIIVDSSSYPTEDITLKTHKFRTLGLGLTNVGALLMSLGLPYDSDAGRKLAASITAILTAQAYKTSAEIAGAIGPFDGYKENTNCMLDVIRMHKECAEKDFELTTNINSQAHSLFDLAQSIWKDAYNDGIRFGYRNGQVTVFAPTGTISFFMDADTTGIEPELALVKYKLLSGSGDGMLKIVNRTVPMALNRLGYSKEDIGKIIDYIAQNDTIEGCQLVKEKDLAVFDCSFKPANGQRSIHYMGHIKMLAACIPYLSGSISKTINMPEESTVDDIMNAYIEAWKLGCKNVAIYRDGSKRSQPLSTKKDGKTEEEKKPVVLEQKPKRNKPNKTRKAVNHEFEIAGHKFYITVGLYDDGSPCELFIKSNKSGSTINGLLDSLGISISKGLQHGVDLTEYIDKFSFIKFEPYGITGDQDIPIAHSVVDYIARWLGKEFLHKKYEPEPFSPINEMHIPEQKGVDYSRAGDTGICQNCGGLTVRSGACRVCTNCGSAGGCG